MNRLARERSPYLLQHAANPVDWYPWGEEAFARARNENKPIFLSIGYSTCHWCHVMEHESFEHAAVAAVLNEHFVPVKVDREERPDVDRVYMTFVQATTGSGGWPMSVWLTPELKPFYGGTYFPAESKWGRPGFVDILGEIARVWRSDEARVRESAESVLQQLRVGEREAFGASVPGTETLARAAGQFRQAFDGQYGGFGQAPKFPRPSELLFLLREHARTGDRDLLEIVLQTLRAMAIGGMRDHIGGGFHRYSVDRAWRVSHFEKMLYDQAQLVLAYIEGAQASGDPFFIEVAEDTLRYVMREMTGADGGFLSAEDADSVPPEQAETPGAHKMEGAFYLWSGAEIDRLFGDDAPLVRGYYGIEDGGNAPSDPHGEFVGKNILYVARGLDALSADTGRDPEDIVQTLQRARLAMFQERLRRPRPHRDDKVLTAWNGLMIAAFARMARLLRGLGDEGARAGEPYLQAAREAAAFVNGRLWHTSSRTLRRRYRDGHSEIDAYAEDYACLVFGLLELFTADPNPVWLDWAQTLQDRQTELFWDGDGGAWFSTTGRDPSVLLRMKETYDGAEPTASAISVHNLLTLTRLVDRPDWGEQIERAFRAFAPQLEQAGRSVPMMAAALSIYHAGLAQVVVVGAGVGVGELERALAVRFLPQVLTLTLTAREQAAIAPLLPVVAQMTPVDGAATAYLCRDFACQPPVTSVDALERELSGRPAELGQ